MKMGTIAAPWRYDAVALPAIQPDNLRRTAILRYASRAAVFPISRDPVTRRWRPFRSIPGMAHGPRADKILGRVSLAANHHRIRTNQRLDARFDKACLLEPADAIGSGEIAAFAGFNQHVQAHQESERILPALVIDDRIVDDERATVRKRLVGLADQHSLFLKAPVMQDVPHDQYFGRRHRVGEEVACLEREPR